MAALPDFLFRPMTKEAADGASQVHECVTAVARLERE